MRTMILLIAVLMVVACNRKTDTGGGTAAAGAPAGTTLQLAGIYATSVNLPGAAYGPNNLFDGSPAPWATMPGADRMEGVMLYFDDNTQLDEMEFTSTPGGPMHAVSQLEVYVDGLWAGVAEAGTRFSLKASEAPGRFSSLYLKIEELAPAAGQVAPAPATVQEVRFYLAGKEVRILPIAERNATVTASSSLTPEEAYSPAFLFDGRRDFGWAEGAPGDGAGESLKFSFPSKITITGLRIWNGYQRSDTHFRSNARVKWLTFGENLASSPHQLLRDEVGAQVVPLETAPTGRDFTLRIDEVFPGAAYQDLVISELQFWDGHQWFTVNTGEADRRKQALIAKCRGTPLEQSLDRTLTGDGASMALRSNGSFVVWINGAGGDAAETVADGNWRLLSADASQAKINIFGRVRSLRETAEVYRSGGSAEMVRIFQDDLTLEPGRVTAKKLFTQLHYQ